jgi:transcriptional regulator
MYLPKHFEQSNPDVLHEFIRSNPFATLITNLDSGLNADHLPVFLNAQTIGNTVLQGHIATQNGLWKSCAGSQPCLVVFQGSNTYISPSLYPSKRENGKVVPTWNYMAVHVKGKIRFIHDAAWKLELIKRLTDEHEQKREQPWSVSDAPDSYIEKLLPAIVGFEIEMDEVVGKFKLSQNQSEENRKGVISGLAESGTGISENMEKYAVLEQTPSLRKGS